MLSLTQLQHLIYLTENHISFIKNTGDESSIAEDEKLLSELKRQYQTQEKRNRVKQIFDDAFKKEHYTDEDLGPPLTYHGYCEKGTSSCPYLKFVGHDGFMRPFWACKKYGDRVKANIFDVPVTLDRCQTAVVISKIEEK